MVRIRLVRKYIRQLDVRHYVVVFKIQAANRLFQLVDGYGNLPEEKTVGIDILENKLLPIFDKLLENADNVNFLCEETASGITKQLSFRLTVRTTRGGEAVVVA